MGIKQIKSARVLIVDEHARMRDGLTSLVASDSRFSVIDAIGDTNSAMASVDASHPDIVLVSLSLDQRDGIDMIARLKHHDPEIKVVALTLLKEGRYVRAAFDAGADAYVLKDEGRSELLSALGCVAAGETYTSPSVRGAGRYGTRKPRGDR